MKLSYKYRLYPNAIQRSALDASMETCRILYNAALQERRSFYVSFKKSRSYAAQCAELKGTKEFYPEFANVYSQTLQQTLKQLDGAYTNFFRRVKTGAEAPGFPRFKSYGRFRSLLFPQPKSDAAYGGGIGLSGKKLTVFGIPGEINIKLHRPLPEGAICKQVRLSREADRYFVIFSLDGVPKEPIERTGKISGYDLGISDFLVQDDGSPTRHPMPLRRQKDRLIKAQRNLASKKRGSNNRIRAKLKLNRIHQKIVNIRTDFQHKLAVSLLRENDVVILEKLNISSMLEEHSPLKLSNGYGIPRSGMHRNISDCSWGNFSSILAYKAEKADKLLIEVDPRNTSKMCSGCGSLKKIPLSERRYDCGNCGLSLPRDHNSAINIRRLGTSLAEEFLTPLQKPPPIAVAAIGGGSSPLLFILATKIPLLHERWRRVKIDI